ncbi:MAG: hypothetical protein A3H27_12285 [Acidobacteria bacterium RIFCSPLOWO2_02_FULL_59_13]|nr:MAG: hypothetical protein A3H27_12285 [Acidobacteria bacterium RIFCSPLOWO2_02_FULL_59_13]
MLPTARCIKIIQGAKKALEAIKTEVLGEPPFDPAASRREYVFSMNDVGEMALLPRIMVYMAKHAPQCNVRSETMPLQELEAALESGLVDMAIGHFPKLEKPGIFKQRLFQRSFACLVRWGHPVVQQDRITLRTFLGLSHLLVKPQGSGDELFEAQLKKLGVQRRVQLLIPHCMSVPRIIAETDLIVTVPDTAAEYFSRMANLRVIKPPINVARYSISQYWHGRFHRDPAIQWIRQRTAELFQNQNKGNGQTPALGHAETAHRVPSRL